MNVKVTLGKFQMKATSPLSITMHQSNQDLFARIPVATLRTIVLNHVNIPIRQSMARVKLFEIMEGLSDDIVNNIATEVQQTIDSGGGRYKRKAATIVTPIKRRRIENEDIHTPQSFRELPECRIQSIIDSDFMKIPSNDVLDNCVSRFIDATSNRAMSQAICASCGRIRFNLELQTILLTKIPNPHLLFPSKPFHAHKLTNGMLLQEEGIVGDKEVKLCGHCINSLKGGQRPKFSLGNHLWVGDIPTELQDLTLPERVLISKYFCAAYIVKLYPKQKGARSWASSGTLHNALKGNVSTYRLDPRQVASMIDGNIYPPNSKILSATIGITFVGPKGLKEASMPSMFRVRRRRIRDALVWLKANNPIYSDIVISENSLEQLPEDAVPDELIMTARYSDNIEQVEKEHAGYVPEYDAADEGM